jgi:hypothetical protein
VGIVLVAGFSGVKEFLVASCEDGLFLSDAFVRRSDSPMAEQYQITIPDVEKRNDGMLFVGARNLSEDDW